MNKQGLKENSRSCSPGEGLLDLTICICKSRGFTSQSTPVSRSETESSQAVVWRLVQRPICLLSRLNYPSICSVPLRTLTQWQLASSLRLLTPMHVSRELKSHGLDSSLHTSMVNMQLSCFGAGISVESLGNISTVFFEHQMSSLGLLLCVLFSLPAHAACSRMWGVGG